jgi:CheY-like chemotaxis protein
MNVLAPKPGARVFVVDDEVSIADTLSIILRGAGFTVHTFYNGLDALEYAQQEGPYIEVSDVIMPKMDGIAFAIKLREQFPHCRVLLISGNAYSAPLLSEWRDKGAPNLEIIPKPFSPQMLISRLTAMAATVDAADNCTD